MIGSTIETTAHFLPKERLGRVLGPFQNEGNEMAQAVLTSKGTVIPRRTLRKLTATEVHSEVEKRKRSIFDGIIKSKLGSSVTFPSNPLPKNHVPCSDDCEPGLISLSDDNDPVDFNDNELFEQPITDKWIHAELRLPQGEEFKSAKVIGRSKDDNGNVVGKYDDNPLLNTMTYNVEFSDREMREYRANVIEKYVCASGC